ncbi:Dol-P-Man:Man(5)GlcNAc(2)-PP-Dol alpha-1,3-mannosyltransferase [Kluyveromyces marxianus]
MSQEVDPVRQNDAVEPKVEDTVSDGMNKEEKFERPPFTPLQDCIDAFNYIMWNPEAHFVTLPLLLILESLAMKIIQKAVSYTEIDYTAYMEQIWMIKNGERNYLNIAGGTGPLVYPAGHVVIYKVMESISDGLEKIPNAQQFFRYLDLVTLFVQFAIYYILKVPSAYVVFAVLSKRLHSIYVLRLFNDCFTTLFVSLSVLLLITSTKIQIRRRRSIVVCLATVFYSMAVSIKMNALLYLPGVLLSVYLLEKGNLFKTFVNVVILFTWQVVVAIPFWKEYPKEYLKGAFDFGRQFMYKWSVNWQMVEEEVFLNPVFHRALLVSHCVVLLMFIIFKMLPMTVDQAISACKSSLLHPFTSVLPASLNLTATTVAYTLLVTNYIGILFARSLHYQFLSWYHWTLPVILYWSPLPYPVCVAWYAAHEWCWNSYPPNATASTLLHFCNAPMLVLVWLGRRSTSTVPASVTKDKQE